jgi:Ca2+-binding EF-hand superfamily protein
LFGSSDFGEFAEMSGVVPVSGSLTDPVYINTELRKKPKSATQSTNLPEPTFAIGSVVLVSGLTTVRTDFNGKHGQICGQAGERFVVDIAGEKINVRPACLSAVNPLLRAEVSPAISRGRVSFDSTALSRAGTSPVPAEDSPSKSSSATELPDEQVAKLKDMFETLDTNGDGSVSKAELIKALRRGDTGVNEIFGLSQTIRQEDGTRDAFERIFQFVDKDSTRSIEWEEFRDAATLFIAGGSTFARQVTEGSIGSNHSDGTFVSFERSVTVETR